jgi:hypothetical protein
MSGFAGLAVISSFAALLISGSAFLVAANRQDISTDVDAVQEFSHLNRINRMVSVEVKSISTSSSIITSNVSNTGAIAEAIANLPKSDVILSYIKLSDGSKRISWFPYAKTLTSDVWVIDKVYTGNRLEESVNPVNVTAGSGHFDPGEVIQMKIQLAAGFEADTSKPVSLTFALSNGAVASKSS